MGGGNGAYEFLRQLFVPIVEMGEIPEKSPFRKNDTNRSDNDHDAVDVVVRSASAPEEVGREA